MVLKPIVHEIRIQNQVIFLDPPIEYARQTWVHQLHDWLGEQYGLPQHCKADPGLSRDYMSAAPDPKFSLRDWLADAEQRRGRDHVYFTGKPCIPCDLTNR